MRGSKDFKWKENNEKGPTQEWKSELTLKRIQRHNPDKSYRKSRWQCSFSPRGWGTWAARLESWKYPTWHPASLDMMVTHRFLFFVFESFSFSSPPSPLIRGDVWHLIILTFSSSARCNIYMYMHIWDHILLIGLVFHWGGSMEAWKTVFRGLRASATSSPSLRSKLTAPIPPRFAIRIWCWRSLCDRRWVWKSDLDQKRQWFSVRN